MAAEGVHSREAIDMVKEHVLAVLGPASMAFSNTMIKMSKLQAAQVRGRRARGARAGCWRRGGGGHGKEGVGWCICAGVCGCGTPLNGGRLFPHAPRCLPLQCVLYRLSRPAMVPQVYAASIMFGYFLRRVDTRFQLARQLGVLPASREDAVARLERLFAQVGRGGEAFAFGSAVL